MQVQHECFNEFPDQCVGCPAYIETKVDQATQFIWLAGMITMHPPPYTGKVVKECLRYHKKKVEYLK